MCRGSHSPLVRNEAVSWLEWLMSNRASGHDDLCWGDPYSYANRGGRRPAGEPLLIWTALIGQAFLDAFEVLADERYLHVAESIGRWICRLPTEHTTTGSCLSYVAYRQSSIHNSNVMGAAFLSRLGAVTGNERALSTASRAMTYTCSRQHADGSWFYAEEPKYHWIDNFHTGYNISALNTYIRASRDRSFTLNLSRGLEYFKTHFFHDDG